MSRTGPYCLLGDPASLDDLPTWRRSDAPGWEPLVRSAWPVLAHVDADPVFALFFEANGLDAAHREPYRTVVPILVEAWIDWAATFIDGPAKHRRTEAETAIAVLDGLLLLRQLGGPAPANRAARRLGVC